LGVIDVEIQEPLGGAHQDYSVTASSLKKAIIDELNELLKLTPEELKAQRYEKFRKMGQFIES